MSTEEISISMLARDLRTTASTISRALNGRPGVSPKKAAVIREYADRLGYRPTPYYNKRSNCLAMLFPDAAVDSRDEQFQRRLIYAAERYVSQIDKFLFVNFVSTSSPQLPQLLQTRRVDGVLLAHYPQRSLVELIREQGLPVVALEDETLRLPCDCVIANPRKGTVELLSRLLATGHRRFAMVITDRKFPTVDRRFKVIDMDLADHGLTPPPEYILSNVGNTLADGARTARQLLSLAQLPDAVIYTNDQIALGAMLEFTRAGIAIPDQISVASFDNSELCDMALPPLTSVELHTNDVVKTGIDHLVKLIDNTPLTTDNFTQIEIDSSLLWRQSCRDHSK
ncbi:MAG: LacI family DNA-binding transcriptional regulator [Lentisphaeria bacterium]|nr:LacI family DNA-binding transcriptional regulator [Lentisphaeria bacterium]